MTVCLFIVKCCATSSSFCSFKVFDCSLIKTFWVLINSNSSSNLEEKALLVSVGADVEVALVMGVSVARKRRKTRKHADEGVVDGKLRKRQ